MVYLIPIKKKQTIMSIKFSSLRWDSLIRKNLLSPYLHLYFIQPFCIFQDLSENRAIIDAGHVIVKPLFSRRPYLLHCCLFLAHLGTVVSAKEDFAVDKM